MILKKEAERYLECLSAEVQQFPWEDQQAYANWLSQTYHYVSRSTRILALAASRFEDAKLHGRFLDHVREERGHEKLLTNDLKQLGLSLGECLPETHGFYMAQYYYLEHTAPASIFGWVLCLEGLAASIGPKLYERVKKAHGEKAASFLKVHALEDHDHIAKAYAMLELVPAADAAKVLENMKVSGGLYAATLRSCAQQRTRAALKLVA